jgi:peptidoglycan hydrolase-like protein with peptidoglycan-binding domain
MALLSAVDPEKLVNPAKKTPANGRGAWTKSGIDFSSVYMLAPEGEKRIGAVAEKSLAHWAAAAGVRAIQLELHIQAYDPGVVDGVWGPNTTKSVKEFQKNEGLVPDGEFGRKSALALFTPAIDFAQETFEIPNNYLRGMINSESALDPGAVGYYIFYGEKLEYRGVDRGPGQINSKAHPEISWLDAFDFNFAATYTASRLQDTFLSLKKANPKQKTAALWDAAIVSHNNPSAGRLWARDGVPPTDAAALYVDKVKKAIY